MCFRNCPGAPQRPSASFPRGKGVSVPHLALQVHLGVTSPRGQGSDIVPPLPALPRTTRQRPGAGRAGDTHHAARGRPWRGHPGREAARRGSSLSPGRIPPRLRSVPRGRPAHANAPRPRRSPRAARVLNALGSEALRGPRPGEMPRSLARV